MSKLSAILGEEIDRVQAWLRSHGWREDDPLIILHPGCHWGCNEWLPEHWATLGDALTARYGGQIVITGSKREVPLAEQIAGAMKNRPIIVTDHTTLPQLAALLSQAQLVISVDTAPTQICQALKVPSVILMGAGNPVWNGPLPGEPMIMLQDWDSSEEGTQLCDFAAGACHGLNCRSRLINIYRWCLRL